ncbi:MAG: tRNA lysidine(34) synthetase TilS [Oscillospiraceae bacterium]|nr:tRNA lysidine(34) synthetase TilS [Oscillospiraceae bacterium]
MYPLEAVREFLTQQNIHDCSIACALSGGADSICLLLCLLEWKQKFHLKISAVHVQHHLRGQESLRDEHFCAEFCQKQNIPLKIISVDVKAYQQKHHLSLETSARECRYQAFTSCEADFIATAHTASDNLETILFRLARGTGLKGLCGIPAKRENYLRPLLASSRQEIEHFLLEKNITYITDSTNLKDDYSRNFIRHHIVPALEEVHSHPEQTAFRMSALLTQEEDFLERSAKFAFQDCLQPDGSLKNLQMLHPALQKRCIQLFLEQHHLKADFRQVCTVQELLADGGTAELLRGKLKAHVSQNTLFLEPVSTEIPECLLKLGENQIFPEFLVKAELFDRKNSEEFEKIYTMFANSALDYDIIKKSAVLHGRKTGLYLKPAHKPNTVSIKKWLQTQPVAQRNILHYLSDENGLLWVQNLGIAERAAVTDATKKILVLHVHRINT